MYIEMSLFIPRCVDREKIIERGTRFEKTKKL